MDGTIEVVPGRDSVATARLSPGLTQPANQRIREGSFSGCNTPESVKLAAYLHQVPEVVHEAVPPFSPTS
jgi:hypothetical protein